MTDRELLQRAAKAAGMAATRVDGRGWFRVDPGGSGDWELWNPLTDDGDALRLAVKLNLWASVRDGSHHLDSDSDFYAATRRAITRAAAAMVTE